MNVCRNYQQAANIELLRPVYKIERIDFEQKSPVAQVLNGKTPKPGLNESP